MKDIKISIVCEFPPPYGGMAIQAKLLLDRLSSEGLTVYPVKTNPQFSKAFKWIERIRGLRGVIRWIFFISRAITVIPRANIIHILSCSFLSFYLFTFPAIIIGKIFRKKIILNYHGGEAEDFFARAKKSIEKIIGMTDRVIVPSGFLQDVFKKYNIPAQIIPNVADIENFTFKQRAKFRPQILVARHLEPTYNIRCAIQCFTHIKKQYPDAVLKIAGDGSERQELKRLVQELGLKGAVEFFGNVERGEIIHLYETTDIFLNSSNSDNMPIAILEAMASGLPVVSTAAGGIPYLIQDGKTGFLVNLGDYQSMAEKVIEIIEYPEKGKRVVKGARNFVESLCWDNIKRLWLTEYESLLQKGQTR